MGGPASAQVGAENLRDSVPAHADGAGGGVGFDVADADVPAANAQVFGDALAFAGEGDLRLARGFADDFDVGPGDASAPAGAEDFEDRFLRGEAPGEVFVVALFVQGAIGLLVAREAAVVAALS